MKSLIISPAVFASVASAQASLYGQCGGQGWTGATTCVAGAVCTYSNPYYSQCLPGSGRCLWDTIRLCHTLLILNSFSACTNSKAQHYPEDNDKARNTSADWHKATQYGCCQVCWCEHCWIRFRMRHLWELQRHCGLSSYDGILWQRWRRTNVPLCQG